MGITATRPIVSARDPAWRPDSHLVSLVDPSSFEADQYRTLRFVIEERRAPKSLIAVTSPTPGDGKTTCALNLAGAFAAAAESRVLVMDLDLRTPSIGEHLGLTRESPGLVDLLLNQELALDAVVQRHPQFRLSAVPAGRPITVPYELLKSQRLRHLLQDARQHYDYVVLDTPPLVLPDTRLVAECADVFVMVVAAHRTPKVLLGEALNLMDPEKLIGIVFNRDDRPLSGYYNHYYGSSLRSNHRRRTGR
jgi:protein-tyrosine kinase